jgi:hypothetical protein
VIFDSVVLRAALADLGRVLELRGEPYQIVIIGGSALLLGGWIDRPTIDVDVVALREDGLLVKPAPLPQPLRVAVEDVAAARGLPPTWLNAGPADLMDWGLPSGFSDRLSQEEHGGLTVLVADRLDLICTKLYAVADLGPRGRHVDDLRALTPTPAQLRFAVTWCRSQDPSEGFAAQLRQAAALFGLEDIDAPG